VLDGVEAGLDALDLLLVSRQRGRYCDWPCGPFPRPSLTAAAIVSPCTSSPTYRVVFSMTGSSFVALRGFVAETTVTHAQGVSRSFHFD
jgi:hypothetical protein